MASSYARSYGWIAVEVIFLLIRPTLILTTAYAASKTTRLKIDWMTKSSWTTRCGPLTLFLVALMVVTKVFNIICTILGILGFERVPDGREAIYAGMVLDAILFPIAALRTLVRLDHLLDETRNFNLRELRMSSGVRSPRTVHGQEIPIHSDDIESKTQVLFEAQQFQLLVNSDETGIDIDDIRESFAAPDCFAVGMISGRAKPVYLSCFLKQAFHMSGAGLQRLLVGFALILLAVILQLLSDFEDSKTATSISAFSVAWVLQVLSPVAMQMFYNSWALELTLPSLSAKKQALVYTSWALVCLVIITYPLKAIVAGIFSFHSRPETRVEILFLAVCQATIIWTNEAWIALQANQSSFYTVPSWAELLGADRPTSTSFRQLCKNDQAFLPTAAMRLSVDAMNIARFKAKSARRSSDFSPREESLPCAL